MEIVFLENTKIFFSQRVNRVESNLPETSCRSSPHFSERSLNLLHGMILHRFQNRYYQRIPFLMLGGNGNIMPRPLFDASFINETAIAVTILSSLS